MSRFAVAATGSALIVGSTAAVVFLAVVRLTGLQSMSSATEAVAGIGDLLVLGFAFLAVIGWLLVAMYATVRSGLRWLVVAVVPLVVGIQIWSPSARGIVFPETPIPGAPMSVLAQNLWVRNTDPEELAERIMAEGADVLVLTEFTQEHSRAFDRAGAAERFPYQHRVTLNNSNGIAVMSRFPIATVEELATSTNALRVELDMDGGPVTLFAIHPPAPTSSKRIANWTEDFDAIRSRVCESGPRTVVAGDFNASSGHVPFRALASSCDLRDANDVAGGGFGATWPLAVGSLRSCAWTT